MIESLNETGRIELINERSLEARAHCLYECYNDKRGDIRRNNYRDVGCGYGINSYIFGRGFNDVSCFDLSAKNLEKCKRRINSEGNSRFSFVKGDAQSLPLKREIFELVPLFHL